VASRKVWSTSLFDFIEGVSEMVVPIDIVLMAVEANSPYNDGWTMKANRDRNKGLYQ